MEPQVNGKYYQIVTLLSFVIDNAGLEHVRRQGIIVDEARNDNELGTHFKYIVENWNPICDMPMTNLFSYRYENEKY